MKMFKPYQISQALDWLIAQMNESINRRMNEWMNEYYVKMITISANSYGHKPVKWKYYI